MATRDTAVATASETKTAEFVRWGLAIIFIAVGAAKVAHAGMMEQTFQHFGYSTSFMVLIGVVEIAGGIGLMIHRLVFWSALGLCGIMLGAIVSHVQYDPVYMALPAFLVLCLLGYLLVHYVPSARPTPRLR